jgi:hypothetical protein
LVEENACRTPASVATRSWPFESTGDERPGLDRAAAQRSVPVRASRTARRAEIEEEIATNELVPSEKPAGVAHMLSSGTPL